MSSKRIAALVLTIILPILFIIGAVASGPILKSLKEPPEERADPPKALAVFVERAQLADVQLTVEAQGEVAPRNQANLAPQVSGRVTFVADNLVNGGFVNKNQLLMRVEDADYKLAVVRAESSVASAQQALVRTQAEADLARRELEDLGIENPSALALKEPQLQEARASLAAAEAQLEDARLQLRRTGVFAPFDGMVLNETVDIGQFVGAGSPIAEVFATELMEVELQITDAQMGELGLPIAFNASKTNPGPIVKLHADVGGRNREWTGRITRTGAAVDSRTRLISIYTEVKDPFGAGADGDAPLAPGLFVDATVIGREVEDVIIIPRDGLRGLSTVYVVDTLDADDWREERRQRALASGQSLGEDDESDDGEKAKSIVDLETGPVDVLRVKEVEVLKTERDRALLLSGVEPGERIIVSPVQTVTDGMRLRLLERNEDGSLSVGDETSESMDQGTAALAAGEIGSDR